MNAKKIERIRDQANAIVAKYNGWNLPITLQGMYNELNEIGVTVGIMTGDATKTEWYINGVEVETSNFIFKVYKSISGIQNEYTIYFS